MSEDAVLSAERFGEFYKELYPERTAYRWHERAARELADGDAWSDETIWSALSAPTGAGKTTLIECFLFALAYSDGSVKLPRRLFWVVDRRNVVDQVFEHARDVVRRIAEAPEGSLVASVGKRLERLSGGTAYGETVQIRLWRGGLDSVGWNAPTHESAEATSDRAIAQDRQPRDGNPRRPLSPIAPAVICSTVDQVGSRLLFRGYGVSPRSRPIEAALVGTDSLIVLDEAHLSEAFEATVRAIDAWQRSHKAAPIRPAHIVSVTATHSGSSKPEKSTGDEPKSSDQSRRLTHTFELTDDEHNDPALAQRRAAERDVTLIPTKNPISACVASAHELADDGASVIGVVANTIASARQIANQLRVHGDVVLIIGPARRLDREGLLDRIPARAGRKKLNAPLFVVGTQTLEVGLDIDFDALVTECAPLASLVQRFGRLDRAGELTERGKPGHGVIVEPSKDFPVYGAATAATWAFLCGRAEKSPPLGFSTKQTAGLLNEAPDDCAVAQPYAPQLLRWQIEMLAQTSHTPKPDPNIAAFLRGERALEQADIQICWRADLTGDTRNEHTWESWERRVAARLPHPSEIVQLPLFTAIRWLTRRGDIRDVADVEGLGHGDDQTPSKDEERLVIRVPPPSPDGDVNPEATRLEQLKAGDVIVVPATVGGCDEFGWDPTSLEPVGDLGNLSPSRMRVLLSSTVGTPNDLMESVAKTLRMMAREEVSEQEAYGRLIGETREWLESISGTDKSRTPVQEAAYRLSQGLPDTGRVVRVGSGEDETTDVVLSAEPKRRETASAAVLYEDHAKAVEHRVETFAAALGLDQLAPTLRTAARHHDIGKRDRRFQAWLNGGPAADPTKPLAKSQRGPGTPQSWTARRDAGWPYQKRHEAISAGILDAIPSWPPGIDRDLLLYLVSTHHGDGRPTRRFVEDREPVPIDVEIDGHEVNTYSDAEISWFEHAHRFAALNELYGPWGLAAIESLLVLADRGISAGGS